MEIDYTIIIFCSRCKNPSEPIKHGILPSNATTISDQIIMDDDGSGGEFEEIFVKCIGCEAAYRVRIEVEISELIE